MPGAKKARVTRRRVRHTASLASSWSWTSRRVGERRQTRNWFAYRPRQG